MKVPLTAGRSLGEALTLSLAQPWSLHRIGVRASLLRVAPLLGVLSVGLFLRLYAMGTFVTIYPDTYGQLQSVTNLLSGDLPLSYLYPPGIALFLAPFFALLPDTLETMHIAILFAGMALIVVAYVGCTATTGDRRAAFFFATAVAVGVTFVFHSRIGMFDVIHTLLVALSLFLAPLVIRRGFPVLVLYGLVVFAAATARYTNVILLPALMLASLEIGAQPLSWRYVCARLFSKGPITVGLVVSTLYAVYVVTAFDSLTRFADPQGSSVIDASGEGYSTRIGQYMQASLLGYGGDFGWMEALAATGVLALAIVGALRLWSDRRGLLIPILYLAAAWLAIHAFYFAFWARYVMPVFFFVLLLAALGLSVCFHWFKQLHYPWQRVGLATIVAIIVAMFLSLQLAQDVTSVRETPTSGAARSEPAFEDIRNVLRTLNGDRTTLISSQSLAVERANPAMTVYDLIQHSGRNGINERSIVKLRTYVDEQIAAGKTVYYHYTGYEATGSQLHKYELGFDSYFQALSQRFTMREVIHPADSGQRLYRLEP
ncbi:MAG: hypothetical protein WBD55_06810 [Dehalococcoidia bacterium]